MAFRRLAHKSNEPKRQNFTWSNESRNPLPKPDVSKKKNQAPKKGRLAKLRRPA